MSVLLFAEKEDDWKSVTGISVSKNLRGVALHKRRDGETEEEEEVTVMGNVDVERKLFKIDGAAGEKITRVEIGYSALPYGLTVSRLLSLYLASNLLYNSSGGEKYRKLI